MFAVGKAKEHVYSLATQLLLQGSAAGAAMPGNHHHHHNHHARQLSTSTSAGGKPPGSPAGPNSCLSPSHQPQSQQPQPSVPELTLEDVSLFRMHEFRLLFLARCCQLHALAGKAQIVLSAQAYETLTDVLRVILREANNEGDFLAARLVYALSDMVGTYVGVHLQSARVPLRKHEAWGNPELYRVTLEECVARDKQQWLGLQAPLQELLGLEGGSAVRGEDVIRLLLLLRLRAIAEVIVQLRRSPLEHEALVQGLLDHCRDAHCQTFALEEVYAPPSAQSMLWLLDAATRLLDGPATTPPTAAGTSSSSPHVSFDEPPGGRFDTLRRGPSGTAAAVSSSSIPNVLRWASETARAAAHWACLGFSVHHALLHHVVGRSAATAPSSLSIGKDPSFQMAPPAAGGGPGPAAAAMGLVGAGVCLCGKPFYPEWRVLGGYRAETERVRQLAPALLCEPCFRALLRAQPLHDTVKQTAAGAAAPVPHRPPQAVGCAPLPAAAEIRTPHSVAALAAAASVAAPLPAPEEPTEPPRPNSTTTTVVVGLTEPPEPLQPPQPARERASTAVPATDLSSSAASSTSAAATAATASTKPPATFRPSSSSKGAASLPERERSTSSTAAAESMRRRSISGSGARARAGTSIAPPPAPPRPQSTRERSASHLGVSSNNASSSSRLSVSGSGSSSSDGRPRLRKGELFALLMSGELEVLKHVQRGFAAPHPRILFVDSSSTEAAALQWCSKEEFAKRQRGGGKQATMAARGGLPLKHLLDVRRGEGPGKERVVTLLFQERPLVVEAFTLERADLLEAVFRMILAKNRKLTLGK